MSINNLNIYNSNSPESVMAQRLMVELQRLEPNTFEVSTTHGNVEKKWPDLKFDVVNVIGVDISNRTMQHILNRNPDARINIFNDSNCDHGLWDNAVKEKVAVDFMDIYDDVSPAEMVKQYCNAQEVWLSKHTSKELENIDEAVFALVSHYRFKKTAEDFSNRVEKFGDPVVARNLVERNIQYHKHIALCNTIKEQVWEAARFLSFSHKNFMLYEETAHKNVYWAYGLSRDWIKKEMQPQNIWNHGVMLTFSLPK